MGGQEGASDPAVLSCGRPETTGGASAAVCPVQLSSGGGRAVHVSRVGLVRCLRRCLGQGTVDDARLEALGIAVD